MSFIFTTFWIMVSEFFRNEFLLKNLWVEKYASLGLTFTTTPFNGLVWLVWSALLAYSLFLAIKNTGFIQAILLVWLLAFVMMWLVLFNLQVLPMGLLLVAVPLSLVEVFVAGKIIRVLNAF